MQYIKRLLKNASDNFLSSVIANSDDCPFDLQNNLFSRSIEIKSLIDLCLAEVVNFSHYFFDEVHDDE